MDSKNSEIDKEKSPDVLSFKRYYSEVCDEEIENAINYLASNIPEDVLKEAFEKFKQNFDFVGKEHFGLGMDVRNLLYREGFDLGGMGLDDNWVYLSVEGFREGVREKGLNLVFAGFRFAGLVYGDKNFFPPNFSYFCHGL
jgi:hypothetical protein